MLINNYDFQPIPETDHCDVFVTLPCVECRNDYPGPVLLATVYDMYSSNPMLKTRFPYGLNGTYNLLNNIRLAQIEMGYIRLPQDNKVEM